MDGAMTLVAGLVLGFVYGYHKGYERAERFWKAAAPQPEHSQPDSGESSDG